MRTTLILDDHLASAAKQWAAKHGRTLSDVVNDALRETLRQKAKKPAKPFRLITFGGKGPKVHHEPADFAAALDEDGGA